VVLGEAFARLPGQVDPAKTRVAVLDDLDDGITSELISFRSLYEAPLWAKCYRAAETAAPGEPARLTCAGAIRNIISLLVSDCAGATLAALGEMGIDSPDAARTAARPAVRFRPTMAGQFQALKDFLSQTLYHHYRVRRMEVKAERVLGELFSAYVDDPDLLPPGFRAHINGTAPERIICDYLAGMTDRYSIREYQTLFDLTEKF